MSKIIFVATVAETHLAFLEGQAIHLRNFGHDVTLVSSASERLKNFCHREGLKYRAVEIRRAISPLNDILTSIHLYLLFRHLKPDLVHLSTPKAALLGSFAAFCARVPSRFFLIRGSVTGAARGWSSILNRWGEWLTVKLCNDIVVVSPSLLKYLREQGVLRSNEGKVIANGMSNGIDAEQFKSSHLHQPVGHSKKLTIGFVGRLNKEKGIEELAAAWQDIRSRFPIAGLLLVGPWDTEAEVDKDIRKKLESDLRVEITGSVNDVRPFYEKMRVLCFPSHREGFPNVVMEAAAMGVPVVGARAVGTIDAIVDGQTGVLVNIGDTQALAAALEQYLTDPQLAKKHGEIGRRRVVDDFAQAPIWDGLTDCYEENIRQKKIKKGFYRSIGKPLFDRIIAFVALVGLFPVLLIVSIFIYLKIGRPIFFNQLRSGFKGRPFLIRKFRTMAEVYDADGKSLPDAQRLTPFGKFLRSSSLDELPELWNILCGQMSFVGPRPFMHEYLPKYSPHQKQRFDAMPGLTGLAQVKGRNQISWENRFKYDIFYVKKHSFVLDALILWKTLKKVFARDGITDSQGISSEKFGQDNSIVLLGAGGHAQVVIATLKSCGLSVSKIYEDNHELVGTKIGGVPVVAGIDALRNQAYQNIDAVIGIGSNEARYRIAKSFEGTGIKWKTVIHKNAIVDPTASIGDGTIIAAGAVIQANTKIGSHAIINTGANVDHDCVVADAVHIAPGSVITGGVEIGELSLIGAGCTVLPGRRIGKRAMLGAGSVITKDVTCSTTVVGCPAEPVSKVDKPDNQNSRWPQFDKEQIDAAVNVLKKGNVNYWTGSEGKLFEKEFADYVGVKHGIAVANGTVALELALTALGVGAGDEVIVPSRTFIASASAVVMRGAIPKIADIDCHSQNITVESIRPLITTKTRAIIVVHLGGWPCEMDQILEFANEKGLFVIEDCAQAHGGRFKEKPLGSFGHISAFSFCQDKIMTTAGEGGMVVTNDTELWQRAWSFKDHGKDWNLVNAPSDGTYRFLHTSFGTNWRMTEVQAAIGRVQLKKLDSWHVQRTENATYLCQNLKKCPGIEVPLPPVYCDHAFYRLYAVIRLTDLKSGWTRDEIIKQLRLRGINIGSGSCAEIYKEIAFQKIRDAVDLPNANYAQKATLAFVVHPGTSRAMLTEVVKLTNEIMKRATKYPLRVQNFAA